METKTCFKCNTEKPLSEFYGHPKMSDGHLGKCKTCTKFDVSKNRDDKIGYYREYDKRRYKEDPRVRERISKRDKKKYAASSRLNLLVSRGKIERGACEICGKENAEGHHEDYDRPEDVIWLCRRHHAWLHAGRLSLWPQWQPKKVRRQLN